MTAAHNDRVREQFALQAATFTDTGFATNALDWIVEQLAPRPDEQALDVACGAGHLGRALAPQLRQVTGIDLTRQMLEQGDRLARAAGLRNICFVLGDATALPWLDAQFDLVVCRITLHQVADPAAVVAEMVRVTRPNGRIGITDMILSDPELTEENTRLERLRDPSHGRTLSIEEIHRMLSQAGARVESTTTRPVALDFEDWMARTQTPQSARTELRRSLDAELVGGLRSGLYPADTSNARTITHTWGTVVATPTP